MIKILSGAVRPDTGGIYLQGQKLALAFPAEAKAAGIGTVFQELSSVADLTVAMNLLYRARQISCALWARLFASAGTACC